MAFSNIGVTMEQIIEWLKHTEQRACDIYKEASVIFRADRDFSRFLNRLADDEALHFNLMDSASNYLTRNDIRITQSISVEQNIIDRIDKPLREIYRLLKDHNLKKADMIDGIVKAEFSEWNDIFLYVINTLKEYSKTFQHGAATIQAHKNRIELFLDSLPNEFQPCLDIRQLSPVWQHKFLVVEDEKPILKLLERLFSRMGCVETATNGQEGLEKTKEYFFDVIISDVDMPVMDGMEFFGKAVNADPNIASHFLFYSGDVTPERKAFFKKNNLSYLAKPMGLDEIRKAVDKIMKQSL